MKSEHITLYFKQGRSDKVYTASLEDIEDTRFVLNFAYGRRGATLTTGTKTSTPVEYAAAKKIYDKLVQNKTSNPNGETGRRPVSLKTLDGVHLHLGDFGTELSRGGHLRGGLHGEPPSHSYGRHAAYLGWSEERGRSTD